MSTETTPPEEIPTGHVKTHDGQIIPIDQRVYMLRDHKTAAGKKLKIDLKGKAYKRVNGGLVSLSPKQKLTKRQRSELTKARCAFRDGELDRLMNVPHSHGRHEGDELKRYWYLNGWFNTDVKLTLEVS